MQNILCTSATGGKNPVFLGGFFSWRLSKMGKNVGRCHPPHTTSTYARQEATLTNGQWEVGRGRPAADSRQTNTARGTDLLDGVRLLAAAGRLLQLQQRAGGGLAVQDGLYDEEEPAQRNGG